MNAHDINHEIDDILAPYEGRKSIHSPAERNDIIFGQALGRELNRLQGSEYTALDQRLDALLNSGRLDMMELGQLAKKLADKKLFSRSSNVNPQINNAR